MDSGDFRKRAENARDEAKHAKKADKDVWLRIAAAYERLADDADKKDAKAKNRRTRRPQFAAPYPGGSDA